MTEQHKLDEHLKSEADFFDKYYEEADNRHRKQNYIIPESVLRHVTPTTPNLLVDREYATSLLGDLKEKKLLDFGAGDGWTAISFAKAGAMVWAIDISKAGVELTRKKAVANGVEDRVICEVQNGYDMDYSDGTFDIIYGGGVLHHLDIDTVGRELSRVLKPDGIVVFYEPLRETRAMDIIKNIVLSVLNKKASEETDDEEPLTKQKIMLLKSHFGTVNTKNFNILATISLVIKSKFLESILLNLDNILINSVPWFGKLGRVVIIELKNPKTTR